MLETILRGIKRLTFIAVAGALVILFVQGLVFAAVWGAGDFGCIGSGCEPMPLWAKVWASASTGIAIFLVVFLLGLPESEEGG